MPEPPKSATVLRLEGKSHRTKAELEKKELAEKQAITGVPMQVNKKLCKEAQAEFKRLKSLFKKIDKDDALYENAINRYCEVKAEIETFKKLMDKRNADVEELQRAYADGEIEFITMLSGKEKAYGQIAGIDRQIQAKRNMMSKTENDNSMTILSSMRVAPNMADIKEDDSPMAKFLAKEN